MTIETGIYAIENIRDRRVYVGATKSGFLARWSTHRGTLSEGTHYSALLQHDWDMYGAGWFKFMPLEVIARGNVTAPREQYWIDRLSSLGYFCYNRRTPTERLDPAPSIPLNRNDLCYTVDEIASYVRCTVGTVRHMIRRGTLSAFRLDKRQWRVTREAIEEYLKRQSEPDDSSEEKGQP